MILTHLLPFDGAHCPLCKQLLTASFACPKDHYRYYMPNMVILTNKYEIWISRLNNNIFIFNSNTCLKLSQQDFINFDFASSDLEHRLDLFLFYH